MLKTIKIIKSGDRWKLQFEGKSLLIGTSDDKIMKVLKPNDNQTCIITDLSSDGAICYFIVKDGFFRVYSYPDEVLYVEITTDLHFFKSLEEGVKYYLVPVE